MAFLGSALASALLMFVILPLVVFPLANIHPGGKQEALGLLFQQTGYYVTHHGDEITPEEKEAISNVLYYDEIEENYSPDIQDNIKFLYDQNASTDDLIGYIKTYVSMGLKHPEAYFDAWMSVASYYISYQTPIHISLNFIINHIKGGAYEELQESDEDKPLVIFRPDGIEEIRVSAITEYTKIWRTPILNILLMLALYTLWIPAAIFLFMFRHGMKYKAILLPCFVVLLFCLISPTGDPRYAIPIFDSMMLMVGMTVVLGKMSRGALSKARFCS